MRIFRLILLSLLFSFAVHGGALAHASSLTPLEGLEVLRRAFVGIVDFSARITQEKQLSLMKKKMVSSGEVRFKKPDTFYMELNPPYASRILLKDNALTLKLPHDEVRQKMVLPPEQGLGRWFALLDQPVRSLPDGFDVRAERKGDTISLRIVPRQAGAMKELQLQFQEDGTLKKLIIEENNRDTTVITFSGMKKNLGLTAKDFALE